MEIKIKDITGKIVGEVNKEVASRAFRAANELRNSALTVLRGQRSGRRYRKPHSRSYYTASAPGEPPAVRSGALRTSWKSAAASEGTSTKSFTIKPAITTDVKYAPTLDKGFDGNVEKNIPQKNGKAKKTKYHLKIAPRPFEEPIIDHAKAKVSAIFKEPYLNK